MARYKRVVTKTSTGVRVQYVPITSSPTPSPTVSIKSGPSQERVIFSEPGKTRVIYLPKGELPPSEPGYDISPTQASHLTSYVQGRVAVRPQPITQPIFTPQSFYASRHSFDTTTDPYPSSYDVQPTATTIRPGTPREIAMAGGISAPSREWETQQSFDTPTRVIQEKQYGILEDTSKPTGSYASRMWGFRRELESKEIARGREFRPGVASLFGTASAITYPIRSGESSLQLAKSAGRGALFAGGAVLVTSMTGGLGTAPYVAGALAYGATKIPVLQQSFTQAKWQGPVVSREYGARVGGSVAASAAGAGLIFYGTTKYPGLKSDFDMWRTDKALSRVGQKPIPVRFSKLLGQRKVFMTKDGFRTETQTQIHPRQQVFEFAPKQQPLKLSVYKDYWDTSTHGLREYLGKYTQIPKQVKIDFVSTKHDPLQTRLFSAESDKFLFGGKSEGISWGYGTYRKAPTNIEILGKMFSSKKGGQTITIPQPIYKKPSSLITESVTPPPIGRVDVMPTEFPLGSIGIVGGLMGIPTTEQKQRQRGSMMSDTFNIQSPSQSLVSQPDLGLGYKRLPITIQPIKAIPAVRQIQRPKQKTKQGAITVPFIELPTPETPKTFRGGGAGGKRPEPPPTPAKIELKFPKLDYKIQKTIRKKGKRSPISFFPRYTPSIEAQYFGLKGKAPKIITGVELRPLL